MQRVDRATKAATAAAGDDPLDEIRVHHLLHALTEILLTIAATAAARGATTAKGGDTAVAVRTRGGPDRVLPLAA